MDIDRLLEVAAGNHIVRNAGTLGNSFEQNAAIKGAAVDHGLAGRTQCVVLIIKITSSFILSVRARNGNSAAVDLHRSHGPDCCVVQIGIGIEFQMQIAAVQCQLGIIHDIDQTHIAPRHVVHTDDLAATLGVINDQFARSKADKLDFAT